MKKFCLPTDFRDLTDNALPFIARLAAKMDADLHLVHAVPTPPVSPLTQKKEYTDEIGRIIGGWLEDLKGKFVAAGLKAENIHTNWWIGPCDDLIVSYCKDNDIDCLIVPTHGRGGLSQVFMGSHAVHLLQTSQIPMLILNPEAAKNYTNREIECVGYPTDFSKIAEAGLDVAIDVAHGLSCRLELVHAIHDVLDWAGVYGDALDVAAVYGSYEELATQTKREAQERLNTLEEKVHGQNASLATGVRLVDQPVNEGIVGWAKTHDNGMIVLASHGYTGFNHFILGSVAEEVIEKSASPVLVIRPQAD